MSARRIPAFALEASLAMALAVAAGGCVLVGPPSGGARSGSGSGDVLVCHKGKTLALPQEALAAHLNHGDHRGPC